MATNGSHDKRDKDELSKMGYETRDVNFRFVLIALLGFGTFAIVAGILAKVFINVPWVQNTDAVPLGTFKDLTPPPGSPILQTNVTTLTDIRDLRQHEMALLKSYGYTDKNTPIGMTYRIPIDQAINLVAAQGIDSTQNYLMSSSNPVKGQLGLTKAGPSAGMGKVNPATSAATATSTIKPQPTQATSPNITPKPGSVPTSGQKPKVPSPPKIGGKTP